MASYPTVRKLSQLDATTPASGAPLSDFDDAVRQLKAFVKAFLTVAHNDDGTIKSSASGTDAIQDDAVTEPKLADDAVGRLAIILNGLFTADADGRAKFASGFVNPTLIEDLAVETAKLADGTLSADATGRLKMADGFVDENKLAALSVATGHIQASAVGDAQISDVDGSKLADKSVAATKMSLTQDKIVIGDGSNQGIEAEVGGALTVSYAAGVATFALTGSVATAATYALYAEGSSKGDCVACTVGAWTGAVDHGSWTSFAGTPSFMTISGSEFRFTTNGTYLIRATAPAYSCGKHKLRLRDSGSTTVLYGQVTEAPVGGTSLANLVGILSVTGASIGSPEKYYLQHWTEIAVTGGFGHNIDTGSDNGMFAMFEVIQIA